jgi:hypothetical protein
MKFNYFNRLLFTAASEYANGGGDAPVAPSAPAPAGDAPEGADAPEPPAAPEAPEAPAAPTAPEEKAAAAVAEPTLLQVAFAAAKNKGKLVAENQTVLERADRAEHELMTLRAAHGELTEKFNALTREREQIAAALNAREGDAQEVEAAAAAVVASIGFPEAQLPEAIKAGESRQEVEAALAAATDNKQRWELSKKLNEMPG